MKNKWIKRILAVGALFAVFVFTGCASCERERRKTENPFEEFGEGN